MAWTRRALGDVDASLAGAVMSTYHQATQTNSSVSFFAEYCELASSRAPQQLLPAVRVRRQQSILDSALVDERDAIIK